MMTLDELIADLQVARHEPFIVRVTPPPPWWRWSPGTCRPRTANRWFEALCTPAARRRGCRVELLRRGRVIRSWPPEEPAA